MAGLCWRLLLSIIVMDLWDQDGEFHPSGLRTDPSKRNSIFWACKGHVPGDNGTDHYVWDLHIYWYSDAEPKLANNNNNKVNGPNNFSFCDKNEKGKLKLLPIKQIFTCKVSATNLNLSSHFIWMEGKSERPNSWKSLWTYCIRKFHTKIRVRNLFRRVAVNACRSMDGDEMRLKIDTAIGCFVTRYQTQWNPEKVNTSGPNRIVDFKQGWFYPFSGEET